MSGKGFIQVRVKCVHVFFCFLVNCRHFCHVVEYKSTYIGEPSWEWYFLAQTEFIFKVHFRT